MILLFSFWIFEELDTFGNLFITDYPSGVFFEHYSHRFLGININEKNLIVQLGLFYEDGAYNKRAFNNLYGGYGNAFFLINFSDFFITIGRREPRISKLVLWDRFAIDAISINYKNDLFSYSFWISRINSIITPESVSLGGKNYPKGYLIDRYLTIRRLEIYTRSGDFYITDYGILPIPYDLNIPFSLLNPFISSYDLQWNGGYETNTILSFTYKNGRFLFELLIDDFQYSTETISKVPPKLGIWSYFKFTPFKIELLYAMPYTFNNKRYVSKWLVYNEIPSLMNADEMKIVLSYYKNDNFLSIGMKIRGSFTVYDREDESSYIFHLPFIEPVKFFPIFKTFKDFKFNKRIVRFGFRYDEEFLIDLNLLI